MARTAYALLGPTASGKSRLALQLAKRVPIEIVSVDSGQIYRGMDIGTAKPTSREQRCVAHHLLDIVDPTQTYSAARFRTDAIFAVEQIFARGRIPLLVGGTMLYYRALAHGIDPLPGADPALRSAIDEEARRLGWPRLHAALAEVDPVTACRLAPTDAQRIQRALEVYRRTGRPLSVLHGTERAPLPFALVSFALVPVDRAHLHARIAQRFDEMLAAGLIDELQELRRRYTLDAALPSMRCVGYRQAWEYLQGTLDRVTFRSKAIAATRQLAKRQLTWLRTLPEVAPLDADRTPLADWLAKRLSAIRA